jgi:hypothetical protein
MQSSALVFARLLPLAAMTMVAQAGAIRDTSSFSLAALNRNDDQSFPNIGLPFEINFFGVAHNIVNVNNNGNLTFGAGNARFNFTPFGLSGYTGPSIVAPFFADVDTRNELSNVVTFGVGTVDGRTAFVANYEDVGYYPSTADKLNSFQVILIDRSDINPGDFDIEFNYDQILWETGSASGGVDGFGGISAAMGYANGTGEFYEHPGSLVNGAFLDGGPNSLVAGRFNSTFDGRYVFEIRNGDPIDPGDVPELPILPSEVIPAENGNPPIFQFNNQPPDRWFDPPVVYGYAYEMLTPGVFFTEVGLPPGSPYLDLTLNFLGMTVNIPSADGFSYLFPAGVNYFTIEGISPLIDTDDPNFANAFPTFLSYNASVASFTMTPLQNPVPEPSTWALAAAGVALGLASRRIRSAS